MSLYQKYRPKTFNDFAGLSKEASMLAGLLAKPIHPRVYLFSGPAGCGKTSMARVLADTVGSSDIREYNSADTRGIDTAREIIEACMYRLPSPTVYLLDEVHQTSKDFQNAMLKVLEDTPANIYFVLCSSEPQKIIAAVKSRCTEIKFPALSVGELMRLCKKIVKAEEAEVPVEHIEAIAEKAEGSARSALVLLEEVIVAKGIDILANSMIESTTLDLCRALLNWKGTWPEVSSLVQNLETTEWERVRQAVLGYASAVLLKTKNERAAKILYNFREPFFNSGKSGLILACYSSVT